MEKKISIIVPTFKEAPNVPPLTEKINEVMTAAKLKYEIVFVDDDSRDGIEEAVEKLKTEAYPVKLKIRIGEKGLSSAVIEGYKHAEGDVYVVMDADLSHPPEQIPNLVAPILAGESEFVIGSRFVKGGSAAHFNFYRRMNAGVSKLLARPFTKTSDPMAGFFAFPVHIMENNKDVELNPIGFKIGLEMIVKKEPKTIREIPIEFKERLHGESKLNLKEQIGYILHLKRLFEYKYKGLAEFIKFGLVGLSGMVINLLITLLMKETILPRFFNQYAYIHYNIALVVAFLFAMTNNFIWNRKFTFTKARKGSAAGQYILFFITSVIGATINYFIATYLYRSVPFLNHYYLLCNVIGILAGLITNFVGSKFIVFKEKN